MSTPSPSPLEQRVPEDGRTAALVLKHGAAVAVHRVLLHLVRVERVVLVVGGDRGLGGVAGLYRLVPAAAGLAALDAAPDVAVLGGVRKRAAGVGEQWGTRGVSTGPEGGAGQGGGFCFGEGGISQRDK